MTSVIALTDADQVFRLVTQVPNDLIEVEVVNAEVRKTAGEPGGQAPAARRTSIRRPEGL